MNAGAAPMAANGLFAVAHTTTLGRGDTVTGALEMTHPIHIEVALKLRNRDLLDAFIANNAKNQAQGNAAQIMSRDQILANHAPTQAQAQKVVDYLASMGYKNVVVAPNRLLISADGTAATARNAFMTSFAQVKTRDGRTAFTNTGAVMVPKSLQDSILSVVGLQNVHIEHTFGRRAQPNASSLPAHDPVEFSSIYGGTGVKTAAGVTVGIFTNGDVSASITDLGTFTKANKLAAVSTQVVQTNGGGTDPSGQTEWDIDSQDIVGMGGGQVGQLIFYTAPTLENADMLANFGTIVNANAAKIVNVSIGGCETGAKDDGTALAADQIFALGDAQGQTFSISTGDSGADECDNGGTTPSWPADSEYVIAVAGTTLDATTGSNAAWGGETVWGGSGGSTSTFEPKPYWQYALVPGANAKRGVADVAFDADPNTGTVINVGSGTQKWGGTSLAAPIFSGLWARVLATKGASFGFAGPLIYGMAQSNFHDITVGNNGGEQAAVGYDLASGRGSIILGTAIKNVGMPIGGSAPVANFSFTTSGLGATFTDSSSRTGGTIVSHFWNFDDSTYVGTATNPYHVFPGAGTYNVAETVVDNSGNMNTKVEAVTVIPGGSKVQLLQNTGFETGAAPWILTSGVSGNNLLCSNGACGTEISHGGQWFLRLAGLGVAHTDSASQQVTLTPGYVNSTLKFYLHIDTTEVSQTRKFDNLSVGVYDTGGTLLGTLATFSNLDSAPGYVVHSYSLDPYIGQTVMLKFIGREDSSLQTTFAIDDVTVQEN